MSRTPRIFAISGPSGVGKGTLVSRVRGRRPNLGLTVSATTRPARPGEGDEAYHYLSDEEFTRLVDSGAFLEWATVHGHRYGTLWSEVSSRIGAGQSVILEIDVQGAFNARRVNPDIVLIFIAPPSLEALEQRLRGRGTEDEAQIELRLSNAVHEMEAAACYDAIIVNDDLKAASAELEALIDHYELDGGHTTDVRY